MKLRKYKSPEDQKPDKSRLPERSRRRSLSPFIPLALVISALALNNLTDQEDAAKTSPELAPRTDREAAAKEIAMHKYERPSIQSLTNLKSHRGYDGVKLRLHLPKDPEAAKYMQEYAANDSGVSWFVPSQMYTRSVHREGQSVTVDPPGEDFSPTGGYPIAKVDKDTGEVVFSPGALVTRQGRVGTEQAIYVTSGAFTPENLSSPLTGGQFVGVIRLAEHTEEQNRWELVPKEELSFPDIARQETEG